MFAKLLQTSQHMSEMNKRIVAIQAYASKVYGAEDETTIAIVRAANEELKNVPTVDSIMNEITNGWLDVIAEYEQKIARSNSTSYGWINQGN